MPRGKFWLHSIYFRFEFQFSIRFKAFQERQISELIRFFSRCGHFWEFLPKFKFLGNLKCLKVKRSPLILMREINGLNDLILLHNDHEPNITNNRSWWIRRQVVHSWLRDVVYGFPDQVPLLPSTTKQVSCFPYTQMEHWDDIDLRS